MLITSGLVDYNMYYDQPFPVNAFPCLAFSTARTIPPVKGMYGKGPNHLTTCLYSLLISVLGISSVMSQICVCYVKALFLSACVRTIPKPHLTISIASYVFDPYTLLHWQKYVFRQYTSIVYYSIAERVPPSAAGWKS